ncbi:MAG: prenyltransferase/squalene oxidase repeat-containing protein [Bryobacteraceae bacterium]
MFDRRQFLRAASLTALVSIAPHARAQTTPEVRALAYLAQEVPAWSAENRCFSCHNNGDAARALYAAHRLGWRVPRQALSDTTDWLAQPSQWESNRGDPQFSDKKLARLQFAAALAEALEAGWLNDRAALGQAASLLVKDQQPDGSWQVDAEASIGSPVTYGAALATATARRVLAGLPDAQLQKAAARADAWLLAAPLLSVLDAAAILTALGPDRSEKRRECLAFIRSAQSSDGGWGPRAHAPPEPFDTAMVLLALANLRGAPETASLIDRGRAWLVGSQLPSGGWPGTTRPPGGQSYAQHISTTGWATLALLRTAGRPPAR